MDVGPTPTPKHTHTQSKREACETSIPILGVGVGELPACPKHPKNHHFEHENSDSTIALCLGVGVGPTSID